MSNLIGLLLNGPVLLLKVCWILTQSHTSQKMEAVIHGYNGFSKTVKFLREKGIKMSIETSQATPAA